MKGFERTGQKISPKKKKTEGKEKSTQSTLFTNKLVYLFWNNYYLQVYLYSRP